MNKLFYEIKGEKGVALLFALGILALILVLALGFATTTIIQRKNAGNNVESTVARLIAESTLDKVVGSLQKFDESSFSCSHTHAPAANNGTTDWLYRLGTLDPGSTDSGAFIWDSSFASTDDINWEYVMANDAVQSKIIGRVAYAIIPGGGIDPGNLVKSGVNENTDKVVATGDDVKRIGVEVNEINLRSIDINTNTITTTIADEMNYTGTSAGKFPGTGWLSFAKMFDDLGITSSSIKDKFRKWFVIDAAKEAEAYWIDDNNDNVINIDTSNDAVNELYHRFNLTQSQADWDAKTAVATTILAPFPPLLPSAATGAEYNIADLTYKGGIDDVSGGIPWLRNWQNAGTFTDDPDGAGPLTATNARAMQIAANLIDYCDSNSAPTTDWDGTTTATYMGNERTPYINELVVGIHITGTQTDMGSGDHKLTLDVKSSVGGELINMYGGNFATAGTLTIAYVVTGTIGDTLGGSDPNGANKPLYTLADAQSASITIDANSYKYDAQVPENSLYSYTSAIYPGKSTVSFKNVSVTITSAKLEYGGNIVDFAKVNKTLGPIDIVADTTNDFEKRAYFGGIQADDPRQNINDGDWSSGEVTTGDATLAYGATPGANGTPNATNYVAVTFPYVTMATSAKDLEIGNDPSYDFGGSKPRVSTAYIRNAPMQSPWELGAIHRGAKWETINLKEFNSDAGVKPNRGGGNYSDSSVSHNGGDANILDQIKMTDNVLSDKKVSLKLQTDTLSGIGILNALFQKIRIGNTYADPGNTADPLTLLTVTKDIVRDIQLHSLFFTTRGMVTTATKLFDGSGGIAQDTDAKKEEIIGKTINLCNVKKSEYFTVIILAQSIKDVGAPTAATSGITINKDLNRDGNIAITNPTMKGDAIAEDTVGFRDSNGNPAVAVVPDFYETITNCRLGQYDLGADEILAEQKIKAEVHRDPVTKKCKILKMEYIEE